MSDLPDRETGNVRSAEAVALFCYQVKKWIGAFAAALRSHCKTHESYGSDDEILNGGLRVDKQLQEKQSLSSNSGT
jgi:butyrate kinase